MAVLGGGVAGLTAAHELAERGFAVHVYEPKALGGKARSMPYAGTAAGDRKDLPGEHGFRFFPGFYQHIPETMKRIPDGANPNGVFDNLVAASQVSFARSGNRRDLIIPPLPRPWTVAQVEESIIASFETLGRIPPDQLAFFARQLVVFMTSSDERRLGQWDVTSWWDFIEAERGSEEYRRMLAVGLTRNLVAAKAEDASTRTIGAMAEAFLYTHYRSGKSDAPDRLLDAPTNEAWIDPWVRLLRTLGVTFHMGEQVTGLGVEGGRIAAAELEGGGAIQADWFIAAMPVEYARKLWSPELLQRDPRLARTNELVTDWMNGLQFYLREPTPIVRGHLSYVDSPFALTSVSQAQFWRERDFARDYGDGTVKDCLSVDISNWSEPGIVYGRPAKNLTAEQVAEEVWEQIKAHLNDTGRTQITDDLVVDWFLDPAITHDAAMGESTNEEQLLINTVGAWPKRPEASTRIPNLFLASDYVQTNIDLATMEGANEAAREAVNRLLDASGSAAEPCRKFTLFMPPEFDAIKRLDRDAYRGRRPHPLQTPWPGH